MRLRGVCRPRTGARQVGVSLFVASSLALGLMLSVLRFGLLVGLSNDEDKRIPQKTETESDYGDFDRVDRLLLVPAARFRGRPGLCRA